MDRTYDYPFLGVENGEKMGVMLRHSSNTQRIFYSILYYFLANGTFIWLKSN